MCRNVRRAQAPGLVFATLMSSVVPAGLAMAGPGAPSGQVVVEGDPSTRVVMRPPYEIPGTRPLYLRGYAGAGTGSHLGGPVAPAGYYARTPRPFGWWLRRPWRNP